MMTNNRCHAEVYNFSLFLQIVTYILQNIIFVFIILSQMNFFLQSITYIQVKLYVEMK